MPPSLPGAIDLRAPAVQGACVGIASGGQTVPVSPASRGPKGNPRRTDLTLVPAASDTCDCPACSGEDADPTQLLRELLDGVAALAEVDDALEAELAGATLVAGVTLAGDEMASALVQELIPQVEDEPGIGALALLLAVGAAASGALDQAAEAATTGRCALARARRHAHGHGTGDARRPGGCRGGGSRHGLASCCSRGPLPAKLSPKRKKSDGPAPIYQLKVGLRGAKPPIWRRLLVPADASLAFVHDMIQAAFGWDGGHMHVFETPYGDFGRADRELGHERDPASAYPRCTGGRRAAPPDDCGGIWGYEDLVGVLATPRHPDHHERLQWLGLDDAGEFDPAAFDVEEVNRALAELR